jgi:Uma2 family endonuclease
MHGPAANLPTTLAEFHAWHARQAEVFEFLDGMPTSMAPGSKAHTLIKGNVFAALRRALGNGPCRVLVDGASVETEASYLIPDVVVECGALDLATPSVAEPLVVVEIASPGSEKDDLARKERIYLGLPSLQHYLVVHQDRRAVVHHQRRDDLGGFLTTIVQQGAIALDPPGVRLTLDDIYEGLSVNEQRGSGDG